MIRLHEYRIPFFAITVIISLLVASPALSRVVVFPRTEIFTEFWVLDSDHRTDSYPFEIARAQNYDVFLGIGNHLGHSTYYSVEVKFRNQTQSGPNSLNRTPSSLPPLLSIPAFVADQETWELLVTFSFDYDFDEPLRQLRFSNMTLNGVELDMRNYSIAWNSTNNRFLGNMYFELWIYDDETSSFRYHERFINLWFNMIIA